MSVITEPEAAATEAQVPSIYEASGGRPSVKAAVDGLYVRLFGDPELSRYFPAGVSDRHRAYLVTLLGGALGDRKSTRLNSSHLVISYAVFCLKKKKTSTTLTTLNNMKTTTPRS